MSEHLGCYKPFTVSGGLCPVKGYEHITLPDGDYMYRVAEYPKRLIVIKDSKFIGEYECNKLGMGI